MPITTAALSEIAKMIIGESHTPFNAANAYLGVGNSNTAFAAGQTDLQGASKIRKAMASAYPQRSGTDILFRSIYETDEANFAWQEWAVFDAAAAGTMLQRKLDSVGTKPNDEAWIFTVTLTVERGS